MDFHVTKYVSQKQVKMRQLKFSNDAGLIAVFEQKQSQIIKNWWEIYVQKDKPVIKFSRLNTG